MDSVIKIGDRIRALREEKGMTQQALADALHVKRETINMWENGFRDMKTGSIILLADFFNVSSDYLLGRVTFKSADIGMQSICEKTGLSEDAIQQLQNGFFQNQQATALLNELLVYPSFHECLIYIQTAFDLIDTKGEKTTREYDGGKVTLSGEFASSFFKQYARDKFSESLFLMELKRRREEA